MSGKTHDNYHHGDLKNALIEAGIALVNEGGEGALSMRKLAAICGVSPAAPYAHFENREQLVKAMQDHVTRGFLRALEASAEGLEPYSPESIVAVGRGYVRFFLRNPNYFEFLFSQPCTKVRLSLDAEGESFPPYEFFKELVLGYEKKRVGKLDPDEAELHIIRLWASVHGVAAIATMKNATWDKNWEEQLDRLVD